MLSSKKTAQDISPPEGLIAYTTAKLKYAKRYRKSDPQQRADMVAFPEMRGRLIKELENAELLGETPDGKRIYLVDYTLNSSVIKELGRLRELTFRAVGEGTHKPRDIDKYDRYYRHIVLWDHKEEEIVGAYRIGEAFKLCKNNESSKLYTAELFDYQSEFNQVFDQAIELGRSFIQPKYWTKRGLDYLWQGIGAYLSANPEIRYMFGAVSISNDYPDLAKHQIVGLYKHFFTPTNAIEYATAKRPFNVNRGVTESYRAQNLKAASQFLKRSLKQQNVTLPTLYKHYAELCHEDGVKFIDFSVDPDFSFCIDGLILVDLNHIKDAKKNRYLTPNKP